MEGRADTADVAEKFCTRIPNAVVMEKTSQDGADINAQRIAALRTMTEHLGYGRAPSQQQAGGAVEPVRVDLDGGSANTPSEEAPGQQEAAPSSQSFMVTTGSTMLDQRVPWYFGVAFAFDFLILHRRAGHARMVLSTEVPQDSERTSRGIALVGPRREPTCRESVTQRLDCWLCFLDFTLPCNY